MDLPDHWDYRDIVDQAHPFRLVSPPARTFLNSTFTYLQEHQSEKIMESFQRMLPSTVVVLRDGNRVQVARRVAAIGDRRPAAQQQAQAGAGESPSSHISPIFVARTPRSALWRAARTEEARSA